MKKNSTKKDSMKSLKLTTYVFVILAILSFLPTNKTIFGIELKPVDIFSDFSAEEEEADFNFDDSFFDDDSTANEDSSDDSIDSIQTNRINQNLLELNYASLIPDFFGKFINTKIDNYFASAIKFKKVKIQGNLVQMKYFFDALKNSKKQVVRIAHYGDSAIEGDNITSELRDRLQKKFGGSALGMLAITSQDVSFRPTVTHSFSDTFENASIYTANPKKYKLGINGEVFIPQRNSWIQYRATSRYRKLKNFKKIKLFYTNAKKSTIRVLFDRKKAQKVSLKPGTNLQVAEVSSKRKAKEVRIEIPQKNQAHFFCVSLENGNGVIVDNFPLRGNSGVSLNELNNKILKEFAKELDYKLIILQFGLNITGTSKSTDYTWYEKEMIKAIKKIKKAFPKTSILLVGVGDKSIKKGSKFLTNPSIPGLIRAQMKIAKKTKIAFWNLFEAMGGKNAMDKWVKANPPLASRDYTHFTLAGAKKVAAMLSDALIDAYSKR